MTSEHDLGAELTKKSYVFSIFFIKLTVTFRDIHFNGPFAVTHKKVFAWTLRTFRICVNLLLLYLKQHHLIFTRLLPSAVLQAKSVDLHSQRDSIRASWSTRMVTFLPKCTKLACALLHSNLDSFATHPPPNSLSCPILNRAMGRK